LFLTTGFANAGSYGAGGKRKGGGKKGARQWREKQGGVGTLQKKRAVRKMGVGGVPIAKRGKEGKETERKGSHLTKIVSQRGQGVGKKTPFSIEKSRGTIGQMGKKRE